MTEDLSARQREIDVVADVGSKPVGPRVCDHYLESSRVGQPSLEHDVTIDLNTESVIAELD